MLAAKLDSVTSRSEIDHELTFDGLTLRFRINPGSSELPPLLLMNGIGARLESFKGLIDHLDVDREVIRFDASSPVTKSTPVIYVPYIHIFRFDIS